MWSGLGDQADRRGAGMLGRVLKNRYKLIDERGRGSMATVLSAGISKPIGLMPSRCSVARPRPTRSLAERFQREFELLSRLHGPHVVSPVDFGEDRGCLFIVMGYVDGHNLKHTILTSGPFAVRTAIDIMQQSTAGVAAAAAAGVVHRDIKPQNLLLSVDAVVKLTDFGLARSHESRDITVTGFFVGTPFYVAPEQVEDSRRVDSRADLYSLGCVFFEVLTGHVPYDGEHAWDVVMQHINGPIPSVCAMRPELPPAFDAFFVSALLPRSADDRFPDAARLRRGARSAANTSASPCRRRGRRPCRRRIRGREWANVHAQRAPEMIVGRSDPQRNFHPDIDLLALDPAQTVSRRHARVTQRGGQFFVEDLNAFNRTRINGMPLVPHQDAEIHPGDTMRLGNIELRFEVRSR